MRSIEYKVGTNPNGIGEDAWTASVKLNDPDVSISISANGADAASASQLLESRLQRVISQLNQARERF